MAWDATGQSWTAAELVADVRRVASLPATSVDFTDPVVLREATDVLWSFAGWALSQAGDGRLVELLQRPVASLLASDYRQGGECELPPLAVADTVESVSWLNREGTSEARLQRIDPAEQPTYDAPSASGQPMAYALLGSRLRLYPRPDQGGTIRLVYQRRHPMLVTDTPVSVGTGSVSGPRGVSTTESTFAWSSAATALSLATGDLVDILNPHYPYRALTTQAAVTLVTPLASFSFVYPSTWAANTPPTGLRVVRAGTSPYVHYPLELRAAVTEKVAANLMRRVGDLTNAQASEQQAMQELARVMQMLSPRAKRDRPRAINPYSHLRSAGRRGWSPR